MLTGIPLESLKSLPIRARCITAFGDPNEDREQIAEQLNAIVPRWGNKIIRKYISTLNEQ
jgi:hypothetical protein